MDKIETFEELVDKLKEYYPSIVEIKQLPETINMFKVYERVK